MYATIVSHFIDSRKINVQYFANFVRFYINDPMHLFPAMILSFILQNGSICCRRILSSTSTLMLNEMNAQTVTRYNLFRILYKTPFSSFMLFPLELLPHTQGLFCVVSIIIFIIPALLSSTLTFIHFLFEQINHTMVIAMHYIDIGVIILQHEINPKTLKEEKHFTVSYMYTDFCGTCINMISFHECVTQYFTPS